MQDAICRCLSQLNIYYILQTNCDFRHLLTPFFFDSVKD